MKNQFKLLSAAVSGAALLMIAGCGGGDTTLAAPTTTNVSTTVVDGAITNALVCLDKNGNGQCDADEVQGRTDDKGNVTLAVALADVGKYPLIAVIGLDAADADNGKVLIPYTMSAPADKSGVLSPLTTLVQQTVASTGASTADATKSVQDAIGSTVSLFDDFTKAAVPTDGSLNAKTLARLIVVTTQAHSTALTALAKTVGTATMDGTLITSADLDKVIQKKLLELLPSLVSAMANPDTSSADVAVKELALAKAAAAAVTESALTPAALTTLVAVNKAPAEPVIAAAPMASLSISGLNFGTASNYSTRLMTASIAQNTPDAAGNTRYVERHSSVTGTSVAQWGAGIALTRNADLHWNGTKWINCPLNFANTSGPRDAQGTNVYNYCDGAETGKTKRTSVDIAGKAMASVYADLRTANYTNLTIANAPAVLASASFPAGARLTYQSSAALN